VNKHRETIFAVVRTEDTEYGHSKNPIIIGVYYTMNRAEEVAGLSSQQFKDSKIEGFNFDVQTSVIYDE